MKPDLLLQSLYEHALINPVFCRSGLDRLLIVSGYATSAMGFHHLNELEGQGKRPAVELIYGMAKQDGISKSNHGGFVDLASPNFKCAYLTKGEAVHAKVYVWCSRNKPILAFTGSANYTQTAFVESRRREVLAQCSPQRAYDFYKSLLPDTTDCRDHRGMDELLQLGSRIRENRPVPHGKTYAPAIAVETDQASPYRGLPKVSISLLSKDNIVPLRSGLNWGQRPDCKREPSQAYLALRADVYHTDFFPPRQLHFTVLTDDNQIIQCSRAQDNGKGIHTPHDNSLIGRYIRRRIGVPEGARVTHADLMRYGRTDVTFYKLDAENFFMDFSVNRNE
jgi:hypothetical protein